MTTVRVTCSECSTDQSVPARQVRLLGWADGHLYWFTCPACGEFCSKTPTPTAVTLLMTGGVVMERAVIDGGTGPAITEDDLLAFGLALEATPNGTPVR